MRYLHVVPFLWLVAFPTYLIVLNGKLIAENRQLIKLKNRLGKQSETFENIAIDCAKREQKL